MKKILFALALLLTIGAIDAMAQSNPPLSNKRIRMKGQAAAPTPDPPTGYYNIWVDSASGNLYITNDAGTDTPVGAGITGLTDNYIPQANGTTAIENSKMVASGTNSGTWTLYDNTAVTGLTKLVITGGAGQGIDPLMALSTPTGIAYAYLTLGTPTATWQITTPESGGDLYFFANSLYRFRSHMSTGNFGIYPAGQYTFTSDGSAANVGTANPASGILAVTDGSTGQGGIGIADAATNTVSDALILRHQGGTVDVGFGTGLLFQAENEAGTMHTIAGIDAVWVDDVDATEDSDLKFYTMEAGAKVLVATMNANDPSLASRSLSFNGVGGIEAGSTLTLESASGANIRFGTTGVAQRWVINGTTGHFHPDASFSNTYDIGTSSAFVRNNYVSTSIQGTRTKTLTDNTITDVVQISSAVENNVTAGHISYTVVASDATNELVQTEVGQVPFLLVNENGTVTVTLGTVGVTAIDSAGGAALSNTFASSVSGTDAKIRITSDYDQATLTGTVTHTIEYRVYIDSGTATVTPQ